MGKPVFFTISLEVKFLIKVIEVIDKNKKEGGLKNRNSLNLYGILMSKNQNQI